MSELRQLRDMMPFAQQLGIELDCATRERVAGRLPWSPEL